MVKPIPIILGGGTVAALETGALKVGISATPPVLTPAELASAAHPTLTTAAAHVVHPAHYSRAALHLWQVNDPTGYAQYIAQTTGHVAKTTASSVAHPAATNTFIQTALQTGKDWLGMAMHGVTQVGGLVVQSVVRTAALIHANAAIGAVALAAWPAAVAAAAAVGVAWLARHFIKKHHEHQQQGESGKVGRSGNQMAAGQLDRDGRGTLVPEQDAMRQTANVPLNPALAQAQGQTVAG